MARVYFLNGLDELFNVIVIQDYQLSSRIMMDWLCYGRLFCFHLRSQLNMRRVAPFRHGGPRWVEIKLQSPPSSFLFLLNGIISNIALFFDKAMYSFVRIIIVAFIRLQLLKESSSVCLLGSDI